MEWTKEDRDALLAFKKAVDSDNIKIKECIKKILLNNRYILHELNNEELESKDSEPDDYFGMKKSIRPAYVFPEIQTETNHYVCYEVGFRELDRYNPEVKKLQITFYVCINPLDMIDELGVTRHDMIAALITEQFNWTNYFGKKIHLISDLPGTTDANFVTRTLIFEQLTDNNVVRSKNGNPKIVNKDIHVITNIEEDILKDV